MGILTLFVIITAVLAVTGAVAAPIVTTPVSPKLLSPGSAGQTDAEISTLTPTLTWEQVFDAQFYTVYVKKFPFAEKDIAFKAESVSSPSVSIPEGVLVNGEKYRWYVKAFNKAGGSDRSQTFSFVVNMPNHNSAPHISNHDSAPLLVAPGSAGRLVPSLMTAAPVFHWKAVPDAIRYGLYISKYPFKKGQFVYKNESINDSSFSLPKGLLTLGSQYRWTVTSQTKTGRSGSSLPFYFVVKALDDKTASTTKQATAEADRKDSAGRASVNPPLSNTVAKGGSPHWNALVATSFMPQQASNDANSRTDTTVTITVPAGSARKDQEATPALPAKQIRLAQGAGMPVMPNEPVPQPAVLPMPQAPQMPAQPMAPPQPSAQPQPILPPSQPPSQQMFVQPPPPPPPSARPSGQMPSSSGGSMVQMQFDNIELRDLIKFVSSIMGKNFIFDDNLVKGKVTILSPKSLTRDEVFRVFQSVLNYYGFSVVSSAEALKVVKAADAKAMAIENLDKEKLLSTASEEKIATLVHPLEYLDSNTMVGILRPLMARDAYLVSVPSTNSLIMIDTSANLQRLKKLVIELDIPVSKSLSSIEVYNVQHTTAADLAKTLQALLAEGKKAATPKDKIFITSYAPTNTLLVSAPPEDLKDIKRIIDGIDTIRPQVLVEAAIVEVSVQETGSLGVDWIAGAVSPNNRGAIGLNQNIQGTPLVSLPGAILAGGATGSDATTGSTAATVAALSNLSGFNVGILGGNITFNGQTFPALGAFIKAIATDSHVNILSTPQILTMNNEEAEIVVGENRPYLTSSRLDSAGNPINTFDYRDVGIKLKVKPYINKDGLVYLTLYQEVTQVTEATVGTGNSTQPAPTTLKRSTKTTVGVKDAQTIVISGLIRDDSTKTHRGIPFLSSIPILGALFGTQTKENNKTNLLVFITPRIIYNAEKIAEISKQMQKEQDKLLDQEKPGKQVKKKETENATEIKKE